MERPIRLTRVYNTSDAKMLAFSFYLHELLVADLADFTAFAPSFDQAYVDGFLAAVEAAQNFSSDEQMVDILVQKTLALEEKMDECRRYFMMMKFFVDRAFEEKPGVKNEFGYDNYGAVRTDQAGLVQFMYELHDAAVKYSAELALVGFDGAKTAMILTLAEGLRTAGSGQEMAKSERSSASDRRVALLNGVWGAVRVIRQAAKIIYVADWGHWQMYRIPWQGGDAARQMGDAIMGEVPSGGTVTVPVPNLAQDTILTLVNAGSVPLRFCGSEVSGQDCGDSGLIVNPGDSRSVTILEIAPDGSAPVVLNVSNTVATDAPVGLYSVRKVLD